MDEDVVKLVKEHTFGTWKVQKTWNPLNVDKAEGVYFYANGKKILDFSSQLVNVNLGYGNKEVIKSIEDQLENLQYISPAFATEVRARAAKSLLEVMPSNLTKFFLFHLRNRSK